LALACLAFLNAVLNDNMPFRGYSTQHGHPTTHYTLPRPLWYACRYGLRHVYKFGGATTELMYALRAFSSKKGKIWLDAILSCGTGKTKVNKIISGLMDWLKVLFSEYLCRCNACSQSLLNSKILLMIRRQFWPTLRFCPTSFQTMCGQQVRRWRKVWDNAVLNSMDKYYMCNLFHLFSLPFAEIMERDCVCVR